MERWQNRVAVVTGANSGIGAATFKDLAKAGLIVVGLDLNIDKIEQLKSKLPTDQKRRIHSVKCNLTIESSVNAAFEWIIKTLGGVDILVNNAGMTHDGDLCTMDMSKVRQVMDVNVMAAIHCTQHAFKSMKDRNFNGHIVILNSILGHQVPDQPADIQWNVYPATKHAITAMVEVYRQEFKALGTKIKITSVSPGLVYTAIMKGHEDFMDLNKAKGWILNPEDISNGIMYAISTPPHVQVHELTILPMDVNQ